MLDNLKALLGLPEEDISQDKKLQLILCSKEPAETFAWRDRTS